MKTFTFTTVARIHLTTKVQANTEDEAYAIAGKRTPLACSHGSGEEGAGEDWVMDD